MNLTLTLTFRDYQETDRPHFTIRTEMPIDTWALQMLVDDLNNVIYDFYKPTFDLVARNPLTGEDILMELGEFDGYRYKYDFSAFQIPEVQDKQTASLLEHVQGGSRRTSKPTDGSIFDLSAFGPEE